MSDSKWFRYFKENMDALGAPCPLSLFATAQTAAGTAMVIMGQIDKYGPTMPLSVIAGVGTAYEMLGVAGAGLASLYVGSIFGSIMVANGKCMADAVTESGVISYIRKQGASRGWLTQLIKDNPALYDGQGANFNRAAFRHLANLAVA